MRQRSAVTGFVMVGLVPTTHVFATWKPGEDVDARHKAEHDGQEAGASR